MPRQRRWIRRQKHTKKVFRPNEREMPHAQFLGDDLVHHSVFVKGKAVHVVSTRARSARNNEVTHYKFETSAPGKIVNSPIGRSIDAIVKFDGRKPHRRTFDNEDAAVYHHESIVRRISPKHSALQSGEREFLESKVKKKNKATKRRTKETKAKRKNPRKKTNAKKVAKKKHKK